MAQETSGKSLNILIIQVDQLAPQVLPVYGHDLVKAPNVAALAADGVVFDNAGGVTTKAKARFPFVESTPFER